MLNNLGAKIYNLGLLLLLAFVANTFVYFSFANVYSAHLLNYEEFVKQYSTGVYQYRFLSVSLLLWIYEQLNFFLGTGFSLKLHFFNPAAETNMFLAFYILNTFFLVLSVLIMYLITINKTYQATTKESFLIVLLGIFAMIISQFVLVPYDNSSYFLLLLFFLILFSYLQQETAIKFLLLIGVLIISTLNRESSALSIALAATVLLMKYGLHKKSILPILTLGIIYLIIYIVLRQFFGSFKTDDGSLLKQNFTNPNALFGILFWLSLFLISLFLCKSQTQKYAIFIFHFFALPYIWMCFYTGYLYEIRLYVPLFLTSILLSNLFFKKEIISN